MKGSALSSLVGSSSGFVSQVLGPLVKQGWIRSDPGPSGGYSLRVDLDEVSVLEVIEAIEGPTDSGQCVLADRSCDEAGHCALHVPWLRSRTLLLQGLSATSVADAALLDNVEVTRP